MAFLTVLTACTGKEALDRHPGPVDTPLGADNKQLWWIPIETGGGQLLLETAVYQPLGPGPFPLVTINHGKPRLGSTDPQSMHPSYGAAAHWFVTRGFAVAVPMRSGYGLSQGSISDTVGPCGDRDYFATALKTAADMEGVVAYLRNQRFVDRTRIIIVGHSYGGLGGLGVAYDKPGVSSALSILPAARARTAQARSAVGVSALSPPLAGLARATYCRRCGSTRQTITILNRALRMQCSRPIAPGHAGRSLLSICRRSAMTGI